MTNDFRPLPAGWYIRTDCPDLNRDYELRPCPGLVLVGEDWAPAEFRDGTVRPATECDELTYRPDVANLPGVLTVRDERTTEYVRQEVPTTLQRIGPDRPGVQPRDEAQR